MISICPFCGSKLYPPIRDGITSCQNCNRVFDNSSNNRMLAAAWICRKSHVLEVDGFVDQFQLNSEQAALIQKHVIDGCCSHDDFCLVVKKLETVV